MWFPVGMCLTMPVVIIGWCLFKKPSDDDDDIEANTKVQ